MLTKLRLSNLVRYLVDLGITKGQNQPAVEISKTSAAVVTPASMDPSALTTGVALGFQIDGAVIFPPKSS